jgi:hypothetical protein
MALWVLYCWLSLEMFSKIASRIRRRVHPTLRVKRSRDYEMGHTAFR